MPRPRSGGRRAPGAAAGGSPARRPRRRRAGPGGWCRAGACRRCRGTSFSQRRIVSRWAMRAWTSALGSAVATGRPGRRHAARASSWASLGGAPPRSIAAAWPAARTRRRSSGPPPAPGQCSAGRRRPATAARSRVRGPSPPPDRPCPPPGVGGSVAWFQACPGGGMFLKNGWGKVSEKLSRYWGMIQKNDRCSLYDATLRRRRENARPELARGGARA